MSASRGHALLAPGASASATSARLPRREQPLPAVDERLVAPETPFEIVDGRLIETMGSNEPHATANGRLAYVLGASVRAGFRCAVDMLTRASRHSDVAPDASVFPAARDAQTGGRQLEHLVFEVRDSQPLSDVTRKAELLSRRGVLRIFCIEVEGPRVLEWQRDAGSWQVLADDAEIDEPVCLVKPLAVRALLSAAEADNDAARALLAKGNEVLAQALLRQKADGRQEGLRDGRQEGLRDGRQEGGREALRQALLAILEGRGWALSEPQRRLIEGCSDPAQLTRWLGETGAASSAHALLGV
jgi:Uma2 family endonuclease